MNIKCAKLKNGDEIIFNVEPMLSVGDQSDFGSDTVDIKKVFTVKLVPTHQGMSMAMLPYMASVDENATMKLKLSDTFFGLQEPNKEILSGYIKQTSGFEIPTGPTMGKILHS